MTVPGGASGYKGPKLASYTPDYQSIINQDPGFMALKQSLSAQGIQNAAQRAQGENQALVNYGSVPDFTHLASQLGLSPEALKTLQQDIDPHTAALAAGNQFSTEASMKHDEDKAMLALRNNLAARGGLSSGEDAYQTGEQNRSYGEAQQNALVSLLSSITGLQQNFTTNQQSQQAQLAQAIQQAEATDSGLPQYQGFSLHYNAKSGKYVGPSGEKYTPIRQGKSWILRDDGTGLSYALSANGSLTLKQ